MVIFLGIALILVLLRYVNTLSFMISWGWISRLGLGVSFGMVGYLFFLVPMGVNLGLRALGKVLLMCWSVHSGAILLVC